MIASKRLRMILKCVSISLLLPLLTHGCKHKRGNTSEIKKIEPIDLNSPEAKRIEPLIRHSIIEICRFRKSVFRMSSCAKGVVINKDGYIVTARHVSSGSSGHLKEHNERSHEAAKVMVVDSLGRKMFKTFFLETAKNSTKETGYKRLDNAKVPLGKCSENNDVSLVRVVPKQVSEFNKWVFPARIRSSRPIKKETIYLAHYNLEDSQDIEEINNAANRFITARNIETKSIQYDKDFSIVTGVITYSGDICWNSKSESYGNFENVPTFQKSSGTPIFDSNAVVIGILAAGAERNYISISAEGNHSKHLIDFLALKDYGITVESNSSKYLSEHAIFLASRKALAEMEYDKQRSVRARENNTLAEKYSGKEIKFSIKGKLDCYRGDGKQFDMRSIFVRFQKNSPVEFRFTGWWIPGYSSKISIPVDDFFEKNKYMTDRLEFSEQEIGLYHLFKDQQPIEAAKASSVFANLFEYFDELPGKYKMVASCQPS